jgi:hypothetical protein
MLGVERFPTMLFLCGWVTAVFILPVFIGCFLLGAFSVR